MTRIPDCRSARPLPSASPTHSRIMSPNKFKCFLLPQPTMKKILLYFLPVLLATPVAGQQTVTLADSAREVPSQRELQRINNTMAVTPLKAKVLKPAAITVESIDQKMSRGEQPGLKLYVPEVSPVNFTRDFEKAMKKRTKEKSKTVGDEFIITGTQVKAISDSPLNVYSI